MLLFLVRQMTVEFSDVGVDTLRLPLQKILDGATETRVPDPVTGPCRHGFEAAAQLVLPLHTCIHSSQFVLYAIFDGLIVTKLEMEIGVLPHTAPVTAIKGPRAQHGEGPGDGFPRVISQDQQGLAGQAYAQGIEEFTREARVAPAAFEGGAIEFIKYIIHRIYF